jgi:hypothetical protein
LSFVFIPCPGRAQTPVSPGQPGGTAPPSAPAVKVMRATRTSGSISIDGKLNEAAWASATPATDFTQSYPEVGGKPTDPTEVRILYDDDALYVGVRMFDSQPKLIAAQLARRDASWWTRTVTAARRSASR